MAPPFREAEFDMDDSGVSHEGDVVDIGVQEDVVEKSGSFFKYKGDVMAQGREATKEYFKQNPKVMKEIETEVWKRIREKQAA